jgi:hypothetical protein
MLSNKRMRQRKVAGVRASDQAKAARIRDLPTCSICRLPYVGFSHDAGPINNGRCCTTCNDTVVIPARIIHQPTGA